MNQIVESTQNQGSQHERAGHQHYRLIVGVPEIAGHLNRPPRQVRHWIASGVFGKSVWKVGRLWVSTPEKLEGVFNGL
jgi:hypothetical protein